MSEHPSCPAVGGDVAAIVEGTLSSGQTFELAVTIGVPGGCLFQFGTAGLLRFATMDSADTSDP
ncbi:MAG: hypothetical protein GY925_24260 [Actinomycetia bacterium]|nr:hypothetical protein [Actinomycetes bacterium]